MDATTTTKGGGYGYSLFAYAGMVGRKSTPRVEGFMAAIERLVRPDSVVLEIGCGPGVFALLAARAGARKVYAIDVNPTVRLGPPLAQANGLAERVEFQQIKSTELNLPERADVIFSDLRGALPFVSDHLASIRDARERLLAPGGVLIPARDTLWGALVCAPKAHAQNSWAAAEATTGLDLSSLGKRTVNHWRKHSFDPEQLLTPPKQWGALDYLTLVEDGARGTLEWTVEAARQAHGLGLWFDCELAPGIGFSNAPGAPHMGVYSQSFLPWSRPLALDVGDRVRVSLRGDLVHGNYVWSWRTQVHRGASLLAEFRQSSFAAHATRAPGKVK